MPAAPKPLQLGEDRETADPAPNLPMVNESERLFPIFDTVGGGVFGQVVAASLILHGIIIAASHDWNFFGEERMEGGTDEIILVEGVDVILLDQIPTTRSALVEANEIATFEVAEVITPQKASVVDPTPLSAIPAQEATTTDGDSAANVPATIALKSETYSSPTRPPGDDSTAEFEQAERVAIDAALATANDATLRPATKVISPTTPEAERLAPIAAHDPRNPIVETETIAAIEIIPEPPLPPRNPAEFPKPKETAKGVVTAPSSKTSNPQSNTHPQARGPSKAKAGAGGKTKNAQGKAVLSTYQSRFFAHLRRYRTYPKAARRKLVYGSAIVEITINRSGRVVGVALAKSSGHAVLDRAALAMVRRASPFPAMPTNLRRAQVTFRTPIRFDRR